MSVCFRLGTCGSFRSECCIDGESVARPFVNALLAPTYKCCAHDWTGRKRIFQTFDVTRRRIEPSLSPLCWRVLNRLYDAAGSYNRVHKYVDMDKQLS